MSLSTLSLHSVSKDPVSKDPVSKDRTVLLAVTLVCWILALPAMALIDCELNPSDCQPAAYFECDFSHINYNLHSSFLHGPSGGGVGYQGAVVIDSSFVEVTTLESLQNALSADEPRIFIPGDVQIQTQTPLVVDTDNVIIAGDRGYIGADGQASEGALLTLDSSAGNKPLFDVTGDNVRISGLRLRGTSVDLLTHGIHMTASPTRSLTLEVDNNEISQFGHSAVRLLGHEQPGTTRIEARVHHNHIHDNNNTSYGYGTVLSKNNVSATIVYNYYDDNRRSVAGSGHEDQSYTAAYNLTEENSLQGEYDMHGFSDYNKNDCSALKECHPYEDCNRAGTEMVVLNNATVNAEKGFFFLRGKPEQGAYITRNFSQDEYFEWRDAYRIWRTSTQEGCDLDCPADATIKLERPLWEENRLCVQDNNLNPDGRYVQYVSWSGSHTWTPLFFNAYKYGETGVGDFDGNGIDDVFYTDGSTWWVSWDGVTPWVVLNTPAISDHTIADLGFGDFNGDGRTDVFHIIGSQWRYSSGGNSGWTNLAALTGAGRELVFKDFNGDGETDVFLNMGIHWLVSWSGLSSWTVLRIPDINTDQLGFGHFDDDGKTDVFWNDGLEWKVSWNGTSEWEILKTLGSAAEELELGDFDGDGITDVFWADGSHWHISRRGTSDWETIANSGYTRPKLFFGDFNGDGKTDVLRERRF